VLFRPSPPDEKKVLFGELKMLPKKVNNKTVDAITLNNSPVLLFESPNRIFNTA